MPRPCGWGGAPMHIGGKEAVAEGRKALLVRATRLPGLELRQLSVEALEAGLHVPIPHRPPRRWLRVDVVLQQRRVLLLIPAATPPRFRAAGYANWVQNSRVPNTPRP